MAIEAADHGRREEQAPRRRDRGPKSLRLERYFDRIAPPHPVMVFLFRRRTLLIQLTTLALLATARPQPSLFAFGLALAVLAEAWRIWAAGTIHKVEELTTGGPYAHVRHPLYVGSFVHAI